MNCDKQKDLIEQELNLEEQINNDEIEGYTIDSLVRELFNEHYYTLSNAGKSIGLFKLLGDAYMKKVCGYAAAIATNSSIKELNVEAPAFIEQYAVINKESFYGEFLKILNNFSVYIEKINKDDNVITSDISRINDVFKLYNLFDAL